MLRKFFKIYLLENEGLGTAFMVPQSVSENKVVKWLASTGNHTSTGPFSMRDLFSDHVPADIEVQIEQYEMLEYAFCRLDVKDVFLSDVLGDFAFVMVVDLRDGGGATCGIGPNLATLRVDRATAVVRHRRGVGGRRTAGRDRIPHLS